MSSKTVHLDYCITLKEIKPWPPKTDNKYLNGLEMHWKHIDGGNSWYGPIKGEVPPKKGSVGGIRVGDSTISFIGDDKLFELHVTLSRESGTFEKNSIEFELRQNSTNVLATAEIDFAKPEYIVQDSKDISVEIGTFKTIKPPKLFVKIETKYINMYKKSIDNPAKFWLDMASKFEWKEQCGEPVYSENLDVNKGGIQIEWFKGGLTNICHNCLDKNIESGKGDKTAFLWEGTGDHGSQRLNYKQLLKKVCQVANFLKGKGVEKGDRVIIYLPMIMKLPITMLACARIGAVHSVVVPGYSKKLLSHIIKECEPKIVVTCNAVMRGKDTKAYKIKCMVLVDEKESAMTKDWPKGRYFNWEKEVPNCDTKCVVEWVGAEDPLFILYTNGRTDRNPKGVLHTTGGYMIYAATTFKYAFDYKESDVHWCTADCGWITGHSYVVYGPLLNGAKVVLYEGIHNPNAERFWEIVETCKVTSLYTSPKQLQSLKDATHARDIDNENVTSSCKTLRVLGIVGEPLKDSEWSWFFEVVGGSRCLISDIWWQTEIGGFMITQKPAVKPGSDPVTFPFFGVKPVIVDENGVEINDGRSGYLCSKSSWPGIFRDLYLHRPKYVETYFKPFPGYNFSPSSRVNDGDRRLQERDDGKKVDAVIKRLKHFRLETEFTGRPSVPYEENSEEFATRLGERGEASTSAGPSGGN